MASRLTAEDVKDIKEMLDAGVPQTTICRATGRGSGTVSAVKNGDYDHLLFPGAKSAKNDSCGVSEQMIRAELSNVREQQFQTRQLIHDIAEDTTLENIYEAIAANNALLYQIACCLINVYDPRHTGNNNIANQMRGAVSKACIGKKD